MCPPYGNPRFHTCVPMQKEYLRIPPYSEVRAYQKYRNPARAVWQSFQAILVITDAAVTATLDDNFFKQKQINFNPLFDSLLASLFHIRILMTIRQTHTSARADSIFFLLNDRNFFKRKQMNFNPLLDLLLTSLFHIRIIITVPPNTYFRKSRQYIRFETFLTSLPNILTALFLTLS